MRKHFLILMLMTLLPLVGWADDFDVQVTTYNGSATWTGSKPTVQPSWFTAAIVGGGTPSPEVKSLIAEQLQVKDLTTTNPNYNVGAWDYQLVLTGSNTVSYGGNNYTIYVNSSTTATLTITQVLGDPEFNLIALAYVNTPLAYDPTSEGQALLSGGAAATSNGTTVPVIYTLNPNAEPVVTFDNYADVKATDAGDYTVYYKVEGTDNYVGSAWTPIKEGDDPLAKNIAKIDNAINDLALAGWTYDPAKTDAPVATGETPDITFTATYGAAADATFTYAKKTNNTWGDFGDYATVVGGHAGKYKVKATIAASTNYNAVEAEVEFTIAKATAVLNVEGVINTDWTVYDGSKHQLFKQAATAYVGESQTPVTVQYTVKYAAPGEAFPNSWETVRTNYDNGYLKKKAAGRYRLNISVEGNDDYNGTSNKVNDAFPVLTVAQADIPTESYTAPAGKTGLRTTGSDQPLVTAGSWTGATTYGTFKYSLDNSTWGEDVSVGNAAGGYTVNAKIDPTDAVNYKATVFDPIEVTIAAKTTVTIATNANQSFGYGTTPVIAKTVTWTDQRQDALNEEGMVWKWYTNSDCSTLATVDGNGNYAVGDYYVKAYGATVTGTTAASQEIVYTPALVKITAGQVTASISATAVYGGLPTYTLTHVSGLSPAEAENFNAANNLGVVTVKKGEEIILNGVANNSNDLKTLPQGTYTLEATASCGANYAVVVSAGTLTVSAKSIAEAVIDVTTDADAIVYNNKAWGTVNPIAFTVTETSGITADDYDVAYSNNVNAGTATITLTGKRNYAGTKTQDFTINKAALTIKANNTTWTYGTTEPTYAVTVEGQAEGETALEVGGTLDGIDGALTVVRTSNETVGMHAGALVAKFGSAQPAESDNYTITYSAGDLQVAKNAITIKLINDVIEGTYGDDPAANITAAILTDKANYELDNSVENNVLPDGNLADILDVAGVTFAIDLIANNKYEVNQEGYAFTMTGATTTNYAVTISNGTYKVNPTAITLYAKDQTINWSNEATDDDTPNTTVSDATVAIVDGGALKCGDALIDVVAEIVIASQNVGNNNISLRAANNANYTITVNNNGTDAKYGNLSVTGAPALALSTADADLVAKLTSYNGKAMPVTIDFTARNGRNLGGERNWVKNNWVTMTLPFNISVADLSKALGYAIVNVIDDTKTVINGTSSEFYGKLTMKGGNGNVDYLVANKPFLVKIADDIVERNNGVIDFGTQTIVAPASADDLTVDAGHGAKFVGTYAPMTVDKDDNAETVWFMIGGGYTQWAYIKSTSAASWGIVPFEGFIDMKNASNEVNNIKFFFEEEDGTVTAIESVDAEGTDNAASAAEGWYTINGVKLEAKPTQKGIYIFNGKKVAIQ